MPAVERKAMMELTPVTGICLASPPMRSMLRVCIWVSMAAAFTYRRDLNVAWLKKWNMLKEY